jgi:ribosomal protein S5
VALSPMELLGGYVRLRRMVNAIAAATNQAEPEIVDGYVERLMESDWELEPETYAHEVTAQAASGGVRPAPAPPAEGA